MINAAFLGPYSKEWMGGINYLSNLLYALSLLDDQKIKPYIFLGLKTDEAIIKQFQPFATIIQDSLFDRKSPKWFVEKLFLNIFHRSFLTKKLLHKYNINTISHSNATDGYEEFITINWIPDFQHLHLPEVFTAAELRQRDHFFSEILKKSRKVIVSSYDAYKDAQIFSPTCSHKVDVLQFVSQPNQKIFTLNQEYLISLEKKYSFNAPFFYLPNQFWKHKNHIVVLEAVKSLKDEGINTVVLCSGYMEDYRNPKYTEELIHYVKEHHLEENIKFLGLIDYNDVLYFIRYSLAVINPSLFEGWSSTVEECKSIGKNMILSNIPIHQEQNPAQSLYFDPHNAKDLAKQLKSVWQEEDREVPDKAMEEEAKNKLYKRTKEFAITYQNILDSTRKTL